MPLTNLRDVQIPGYGTLAGEPPPVDKFRWLRRGYVVGLLSEMGPRYGTALILVFYLWIAPFFGALRIDKEFPCQIDAHYIRTYLGSAVCEYTKTYVWSFPQIFSASLLLMISRDFVQKRFYYFLLKNGGVMSFMLCPVLRDTILVANIWAFAHYWFFVLLVFSRLFVAGIDPRIVMEEASKAAVGAVSKPRDLDIAPDRLAKSGDPEGLQLLIQLLVMLGIPGVLFFVKLIVAYYIEWTLVPLSEYVRDTTTGVDVETRHGEEDHHDSDIEREDTGVPPLPTLSSSALGDLIAIKDNCTRPLLEIHLDSILKEHGRKHERYQAILQLYKKQGWYKLSKEPQHVELLDGLWPAPFLLAPSRPSLPYAAPWSFYAVFMVFRRVGLFVCGFTLFVQAIAMILDTRRAIRIHPLAAFSLLGEVFNVYFIGLIWHRFYVAKAPTETGPEESTGKATETPAGWSWTDSMSTG